MTTSTQTQLRRGTSSACDAATPADGEILVDQSNKRLRLGDGTTAGGIVIGNAADILAQSFVYAPAGGTANALTLTLAPAPAGYTTGMMVAFKASASNTGAPTLNVNGLGAKNIYKITGGSVSALASGDIVSGGAYQALYDGTQFILLNGNLSSQTTLTAGSFLIGAWPLDTVYTNNDVNRTTYYKHGQRFYIPYDGTVSTSFEMNVSLDGATAYARIYKNGSAAGTERTNSTNSYVTYTENLSVAAGDYLELYLKTSSGTGRYTQTRNFELLSGTYMPGLLTV